MRATAYLLSAAVLGFAVPAAAQVTDAVTTPQQAQAPGQGVANAAVTGQTQATDADTTQGDADAGALNAGDIVITATRRAERLSDVPIAVSAVSQETLQNSGANDIRGLVQLAPSLLVSSTGSEANASARIRGIGTVGDNPGLESSVATFIDGVYRSRTGSGLNDIGEIDRVEVLRGPQGTLFGRNASAGLINIITKAPEFRFGGYGEATYGNYNTVRVAGAVTGPLVADLLAFRLDGVYNRRDGFLYDVVNDTDYNDRNRVFVRGQLQFEPSADLQVRLIGDFTSRDEKCCGAVYVDLSEKIDPTPGVPGDYAINPAGNRIQQVLAQLGGVFPSAGDPYNRRIANTRGRAYSNEIKDYGGSMQVDWNLGAAALTSITAYREYKADGAGDFDYSNVDITYRPDDGNAFRQFHTFTQELRLNGELFGDRVNWLIGGYYSNEDLVVRDNLKFGAQYGAFAACRVVATINPLAALRNPANPGCLGTTPLAPLGGATGRQAVGAGLGALATPILATIDRLSTLNELGDEWADFIQDSETYAVFTHNIVKLTDRLSITAGLRYTWESKDLRGTFSNNNTLCPAQQADGQRLFNAIATAPGLTAAQRAQLSTVVGGIVTLTCTGNSSSSLNALDLRDGFNERQLTGTGVVSWKPTDRWLVYGSVSRGYKAGGYNLERSDLTANAFAPPTNASAARLRFDPELVNSYEAGFKFSSADFTMNVAAFRSDFENFQLNTFNGTNFIVQNIARCETGLNGGDTDGSASTGTCAGDTRFGVRSQGVEVEAGLYPTRDVAVNMGYTFADTRFRRDLVGSRTGEALDPALFLLAGSQLSNAPRNTATVSASFTPQIGSSGLSLLFYADGRLTSDFNTGSDLFLEKAQDGFFVANARIGLRGAERRWAVEAFVLNVFDQNYQQVTFAAPFQGSGSLAQTIRLGTSPANQIFTSYLAEPRTYGLTLRSRF